MMDISATHAAARLAATRTAALQASYAQLENGPGAVRIALYGDPRPAPGETPAATLLAVIEPVGASVIDGYRLIIPTPAEGQIVAQGAPTWARISNRAGGWWADVSVSDRDGDGEIRMDRTDFVPGAFARLVSAVVQG